MKIDIIAGARPNFMKIAPIIHEINKNNDLSKKKISFRLIHTGQHYDKNMSDVFFSELGIPEPDINLNVGSGSQAYQTARIMERYEKFIIEDKPDYTLVVGDVNSTLACSVTAKKLLVKVIHVEAGIRSGDLNMPEEINRMVTDSISDFYFTTSDNANDNLRKTGADESQIFFVGNTMIDTLTNQLPNVKPASFFNEFELNEKAYIVLTLHRPSNVDETENLTSLIHFIDKNSGDMKVIFPIHPRTKSNLDIDKIKFNSIKFVDPQPYRAFIHLISNSEGVITDSGGITEETTVLQIPCITLRDSTERPETVTLGTNELIGSDRDLLAENLEKIKSGNWKKGIVPKLWDGKTAQRIVKHLTTELWV